MLNNPNPDLVKVNAYAKFDQIPSIPSQGIEWKQNFDNNKGTKPWWKFFKTDM